MANLSTGEAILGTALAEAEKSGVISSAQARSLNEDLQHVVTQLEHAYGTTDPVVGDVDASTTDMVVTIPGVDLPDDPDAELEMLIEQLVAQALADASVAYDGAISASFDHPASSVPDRS